MGSSERCHAKKGPAGPNPILIICARRIARLRESPAGSRRPPVIELLRRAARELRISCSLPVSAGAAAVPRESWPESIEAARGKSATVLPPVSICVERGIGAADAANCCWILIPIVAPHQHTATSGRLRSTIAALHSRANREDVIGVNG